MELELLRTSDFDVDPDLRARSDDIVVGWG